MQLYVLGHPVSHSKSPVMHNALYKALGLNWHYGLKDCASESQAKDFLQRRDFLGVNITTPYKPSALQAADILDASAQLAQGANVLVRSEENFKAYNFDGFGCVRYLEMIGLDFAQQRIAICGTGPTSLAILHAALEAGAQRVCLFGRNAKRTQDTLCEWKGRARDIGIEYDACVMAGNYDDSIEELAAATLVIDATPLGMKPTDPAPFNVAYLRPNTTVFDVVYGHGETALARAAHERNCTFYNGEGMLVAQAVLGAEQFLAAADIVPHGELDFGWAYKIMCEAAGFKLR